jgi:hypothetical protein
MRVIRRAVPAALLGAAALLTVTAHPPASGAARRAAGVPLRHSGAFQAHVTPTFVAPGGRVMLFASGCRGGTRVSSGIFEAVRLGPGSDVTTVAVDSDAQPGTVYPVRFGCADGAVRSVGLAVTGGHRGGPPRHGVRAGVGGTSLGGFDLQQIAVGALLIAGALGLAYRRSRRHPSEGPQTPGGPASCANRTS